MGPIHVEEYLDSISTLYFRHLSSGFHSGTQGLAVTVSEKRLDLFDNCFIHSREIVRNLRDNDEYFYEKIMYLQV